MNTYDSLDMIVRRPDLEPAMSMAIVTDVPCVLLDSPKQISDNANAEFGNSGVYAYLHSYFQATATVTVKTVVVMLSQHGTFSGSVQLALCTSTGTPKRPDVVVNADNAFSAPYAYGYHYARFSSGYLLTSGEYYHIRLYTSGTDGSNHPIWRYNNAGAAKVMYSSDGTTWNYYADPGQGYFELSECLTYVHT